MDSPAPLSIFIGYDARMPVLYHVASHSIIRRASVPVSITPMALSTLSSHFTRPTHPLQSTEFSFSRFLVPYLSRYQGWALFMDNDTLALDDIARLFALRDDRFAVQVVKHDYTPRTDTKFLGQPQTAYARKNWSSVMLMNCARCTALTPDYVNQASGLDLHRFMWLEDEMQIGALPARWNFLVGEYDPLPPEEISLLHYTLGGPYFTEYAHCDYAALWLAERDTMLHATQIKARL